MSESCPVIDGGTAKGKYMNDPSVSAEDHASAISFHTKWAQVAEGHEDWATVLYHSNRRRHHLDILELLHVLRGSHPIDL